MRNMMPKIIWELKKHIGSERFKEQARETEVDFTRNRKFQMQDYILTMIQRWGTSLSAVARQYAKHMKVPACTRQAYSQGRKRIKAEAIQGLIHSCAGYLLEHAGRMKDWKGYQLLAIDGSRINLPDSTESREHFGFQKSTGEQPQGLFSGIYDVLNRIFLDAELAPCAASERDLALRHVQRVQDTFPSILKNSIILFDRGYPSAELLWAISEKLRGPKYLMRCCTEFIRGMKLSGNDCTISHRFRKLDKELKLRVIRFSLPDGSEEILLTNLFSKRLGIDDFKALYHLRWGIETAYNYLKNRLELENYSSVLPKGILQDTYAAIVMMNLLGFFLMDLRHAHPLSPNKAYNGSECFRILNENFLRLFRRNSPAYAFYSQLLLIASLFYAHVKSGRHFERKICHKSARFHSKNRGS